MKKGILFVITGPSGAGKTTLLKSLTKEYPELSFSVSYTTRPIRKGEQNGKDYWFVSEEEFNKKMKDGDFLEYAQVHGYYYGTSAFCVSEELEHANLLLDIDVQGAVNVKHLIPDSTVCFIAPPGYDELVSRLTKRGTESEADLKKRLDDAIHELKEIEKFDYLIINDNAKHAYEQLKLVYAAEKLRVSRCKAEIEAFKNIDKRNGGV
ncbi:MAG TPA: guanylate kinase [Thermotogota bacterium]|nr:guanylate kinase [Thermotogota bacterium]